MCKVDMYETYGLDWVGIIECICAYMVNLGFPIRAGLVIMEPVTVQCNGTVDLWIVPCRCTVDGQSIVLDMRLHVCRSALLTLV